MKKYLQIVIAATLFGTIGIFIKLIGDSLHPMTLNFHRVFFGFLTLLVLCPILDKNTFRQSRQDIKVYALIGFLIAITVSTVNFAFQYSPVHNVMLLLSIFPVFVFIFASIILKEKITRQKLIALLIAVVGLFIINPLSAEGFLGGIFALVSAATFGMVLTLMRLEDKNHTIGDVMWFLMFASIFLLPFPFIYSFGTVSIYVISIGVLSTGTAYLMNNLALQKIEAETTSIITTVVQTIVGILLAVFILGESLNLQIMIGGAILLLAGIYLQYQQLKQKKAVAAKTPIAIP